MTTAGIDTPQARIFEEGIVLELLDNAEEVDSEPWRHGRRVTFVFEHDGAHWRVTLPVHHDDGIQVYGPVTCTRVYPTTKVVRVWRSAKELDPHPAESHSPTSRPQEG